MTTERHNNYSFDQTPLGAIWRFRWFVLLAIVLGGASALLFGSAIKSTQYQATASLVVTDPRATTLFSADDAAQLSATRYVEDQVAILLSDSVAQRASELISTIDSGFEIDRDTISDDLRVFADETNEILVRFASTNELTSVTTANSVIEAYELVRREQAARQSASAIEQLGVSIANIDIELAEIEEEVIAATRVSEQTALDEQLAQAIGRLVGLQPLLATSTGQDLLELRADLADIDQLLVRYSQIAGTKEGNPRVVQLFRDQTTAIQRRSALAQQRDQLLVDTELLSGGISLSSPAQSAEAVETPVLAITILGALLGLFASSGFAYLLSGRRRKLDERAQPGWLLQTSMLAEIPVFGDEGLRTELPVLEYPASASAEAFRFVATALDLPGRQDPDQQSLDARQPHTYLVTSPGPKEGKTVLTANLALAAARKGKSVLAIDADFGNQRLSSLLRGEHDEGPGLTEVVEAGLDIVSGTFSLGPPGPLDLMSRGKQRTNAPDFFSLPATQAFIAKVGHLYDIVLIDGPPMLHVAYASILAQYVDRVIVVTQHGGSVNRLEDMAQRLDLVGTPLAGYVYNGAPLRYEMTLTEGSLKDVLGEGTSD